MTRAKPLLEARGIRKRFGGFQALDSVEMTVREGERVGLIGPNGSGKSTLVNCLSGAARIDDGNVVFAGRAIESLAAHQRTRLGLVRTFQIPLPFGSMSVAENLAIPLHYAGRSLRATGGAENETEQVMEILRDVGLLDKADEPSTALTQVEMRKLELARAVAAGPKLLIADETMAGLSHSEVDEILDLLFKLNDDGVAIIMIEHIMRAVMAFSQRAIVLVAGRKIADDVPEAVLRNDEVVRAYLGE